VDIDPGIEGNTDIRTPRTTAAKYPLLVNVLTNDIVLDRFDSYDAKAKAAKTRYRTLGVISLVLVFLSLEWEVVSLTWAAWGGKVPFALNVIFGAVGVTALLLIIYSRLKHFRSEWLLNVFLRERIRHWRHQLVLDGVLMDMSGHDQRSQIETIRNRWNQFVDQDLAVGDGWFDTFVTGGAKPEGPDTPLLHPHSAPTNSLVLDEVLLLQREVRLQHQLDYANSKTASEGQKHLFSVAELTDTIDKAATTTLALAVAVIVTRFFVEFIHDSSKALIVLAGTATALAVASAAIRALRSGLAIPGERDSYVEYAHRMEMLANRFDFDHGDRWEIVVQTEIAAVEELRRFLVAESKSRFIVF
jgi:hypothetical protein